MKKPALAKAAMSCDSALLSKSNFRSTELTNKPTRIIRVGIVRLYRDT